MQTGIYNPNYQPTSVYYTPGQFQNLQGQVHEVTDIMRDNIRLGLDRGVNLDNLERQAENLNDNSQQFAYTTGQVHKKYWWKNVQMWVIIVIIVIIVLTLIIVLSVLAAKNKI